MASSSPHWFCAANVEARYINLEKRQDRRRHFEKMLALYPSPFGDVQVQRLDAVLNSRLGALGCVMSHIKALFECLRTNKPYIMIFEDDFALEVTATEAQEFFRSLPPLESVGVNMLCLSYYARKVIVDPSVASMTCNSFVPATDIQTAAGFIATRSFVEDKLLPLFLDSAARLGAGESVDDASLDVLWKKIQPFHIAVPRIGRQRTDFSNILTAAVNKNMAVDYGGTCEALIIANSAETMAAAQELRASCCFRSMVFHFENTHNPLRDVASSINHFLTMDLPTSHILITNIVHTKFNSVSLFKAWQEICFAPSRKSVHLYYNPGTNCNGNIEIFVSRALAQLFVAKFFSFSLEQQQQNAHTRVVTMMEGIAKDQKMAFQTFASANLFRE